MESVKTERSGFEEEGLVLIDKIDAQRAEAEELQAALNDAQSIFDAYLEEAAKLDGELRVELAQVSEGRDELLAALPTNLIERYGRVFDARDQLAVCQVDGETCLGCYSSIPPNLQVKLHAGSAVVFCDNCQRVLYYPE